MCPLRILKKITKKNRLKQFFFYFLPFLKIVILKNLKILVYRPGNETVIHNI